MSLVKLEGVWHWKLVWWEDECARSDPSAEKWEAAYERITGLSAPALGEGFDHFDSTTWFLSETVALVLWPDGYSLRRKNPLAEQTRQ